MFGNQWHDVDIELLRKIYANLPTRIVAKALRRPTSSVYGKAQQLGLKKSQAYLESEKSVRIARGKQSEAMRATQFKKGLTPWNKGMKGLQYEGSKATQFKPGHRAGAAQKLWVPIGSLRISKDGYLERKTRELGHGAKNFVAVHRLVWMEAHGPIPDGWIVIFKPGLRTAVEVEITIDRLECISRAENARRNHWKNRHPELAALIPLKGAITRQVNRITRESEEGATA